MCNKNTLGRSSSHSGFSLCQTDCSSTSNRYNGVNRRTFSYSPFPPGCARTEGYYKVVKELKISPVKTANPSQSTAVLPQALLDTSRTSGAQLSRELRSENRRNLAALGDAEFADHFKFSQLKVSA